MSTFKTNDPLKNLDLPPNWNYEQTVMQVEAIVAQIESGELELADVFEQFSQAVIHLNQCEMFLREHQQAVDLLIQTLSDEDF